MTMYYIARPGGEKEGPFPESTVRANLLHEGHYAADTLVWCKGMADWRPLADIFGVKAEASPAVLTPKAQTKYFIAERGGKARGPYTLPTLLALAYPFTAQTLAWHKGMAQWEPLPRVPGLALLATKHAAAPRKEREFLQYVFPAMHERGTRSEFLASAACAAVMLMAVIPMLASLADTLGIHGDLIGIFCCALFLLTAVHMFMQSARRLHDIGITSLSLVFFIIPIIGWLPFAITALMPGNRGSNNYGPDPRRGLR